MAQTKSDTQASGIQFITVRSPDQWRGSKLIGVDVVDPSDQDRCHQRSVGRSFRQCAKPADGCRSAYGFAATRAGSRQHTAPWAMMHQWRWALPARSNMIGNAAGRGIASRDVARRTSASVCRKSANQFCTVESRSVAIIACQRERRSSTLMARAVAICRAVPSISCALTLSAASSCLAAPANAALASPFGGQVIPPGIPSLQSPNKDSRLAS